MKEYFDKSFFANPLTNYLRWLSSKCFYQLKYWGKHLRINYGTVIRNSTFGKYNWIGNNNIILNCQVGDYTYVVGNSVLMNSKIGKYCSIALNVKIAIGSHPTSGFISTHPSTYSNPNFHSIHYTDANMFLYDEYVEIGNDVWIGTNVVIINGVKIGDGAIIAANSVVTKNVDDYEIVGGTPAKSIRRRFSEEHIKILKEFKWWNKDENWMKLNISKFWSINDFFEMNNP